jgi:hypothetical protein
MVEDRLWARLPPCALFPGDFYRSLILVSMQSDFGREVGTFDRENWRRTTCGVWETVASAPSVPLYYLKVKIVKLVRKSHDLKVSI